MLNTFVNSFMNSKVNLYYKLFVTEYACVTLVAAAVIVWCLEALLARAVEIMGLVD